MPTAEDHAPPAPRLRRARGRAIPVRERWSRRAIWLGLAAVLAGGLALRLWGVRHGLPYVFNSDEADHFVPRAIEMFAGHTLNPHYFANPPAFTYLLHALFWAWYGGGGAAQRAFALHPETLYTIARVSAALLGVLALWLLYATGARLIGRAAGLLAAAIEAVAFLPVFYAHLALNDVPTLLPLTLSLYGSAGVLVKGRLRDYLLAGGALGLACATKYTAGIVLLPLLAAGVLDALGRRPAGARERGEGFGAPLGMALAGVSAVLVFLAANPYALLDFSRFHSELVHQSSLSAEAQGKLGAPHEGGIAYYLWSFTWGLGWVPSAAALGGALGVWRSSRPHLGWLLVPAPLAFLLFMGLQGRFFGRWLMPSLPLLCLLAALFALQLAERVARSMPAGRAARATLAVLIAGALLAQGLVYSVHSGLVLARADTRNITRAWMLAHVPAGTRVVLEPVSPNEWDNERRPGTSSATNPQRWPKYASLVPRISSSGALQATTGKQVVIEDYVRTLAPALIGWYESHGYCLVVSGSTQSGRAFADPGAVPHAIAYYRELARRGRVVFRASPYQPGARPVAFGFDWSFDYYPLAYERPGPLMRVYRLRGGRCGR
jgi:4-amino-4-deoxy-L-arabinose transferase-like glycosyltransferase